MLSLLRHPCTVVNARIKQPFQCPFCWEESKFYNPICSFFLCDEVDQLCTRTIEIVQVWSTFFKTRPFVKVLTMSCSCVCVTFCCAGVWSCLCLCAGVCWDCARAAMKVSLSLRACFPSFEMCSDGPRSFQSRSQRLESCTARTAAQNLAASTWTVTRLQTSKITRSIVFCTQVSSWSRCGLHVG